MLRKPKTQVFLFLWVALLMGCAAFPIGPKRTFRNWDDAPPVATSTSMTPAPAQAPSPTTHLVVRVTATPEIVPTQATTDTDIEYAFPSPMTFTPGQTPTEFGIQINGCDRDVPAALAIAKRMGLTWIKQQARWGDIEKAPGQFDWACLDRVIPEANAQGFKVLISVTTAAAHTRHIYKGIFHATNGRPADLRDFGLFLAYLITRYPKQIHAIEMWNEPNLVAEWGDVIDGGVYAGLLAIGYGVTKFIDPSIMVISAGIAPTGFNQQWVAMDDAPFLRQFLDYQGASYADCLGVHANGPDGVGEIDRVGPRYFDLAGQQHPICVTEFGYGLPVDGRAPEGFDWVMSHTPERQAEALTHGLVWAKQSGYARLVILWNLNFDGTTSDPNAPYALVREGWESPAIQAIEQILTAQK